MREALRLIGYILDAWAACLVFGVGLGFVILGARLIAGILP